MLLTSSVQNNLSRSHENSPTKPDIINTPDLLYLAVISRDLCEKKRTSKHTFSPNVEKGSQVMATSIWAWTSPGSFAHARSPCIVKHLIYMQASWSRQTTAKVAAALSECFEWHILKIASVVPSTSAREFCSSGGSNKLFCAQPRFVLQHELLQHIARYSCQLFHRRLAVFISLLLPHVCRLQYCLLNDLTYLY